MKKTVKQVLEQEGQSTNVMILGLPDTEDEETEKVIKPVLLEIGEDPKVVERELSQRLRARARRRRARCFSEENVDL